MTISLLMTTSASVQCALLLTSSLGLDIHRAQAWESLVVGLKHEHPVFHAAQGFLYVDGFV